MFLCRTCGQLIFLMHLKCLRNFDILFLDNLIIYLFLHLMTLIKHTTTTDLFPLMVL